MAPEYEEKYAEHAYVHAMVDGFEVDLVPCYLVDDAIHAEVGCGSHPLSH